MRSIAAFLVTCSLAGAGVPQRGVVTSVKVSAPSVAVGAPLSVSVGGTNPCGAAWINYGDGTAITYAITELPTTQTHPYAKPGPYTITAKGMGNCDGEVTTRVQVTGPAPAPAPPAPPPSEPANAITYLGFAPKVGIPKQPVAINVAGRGTCAFTVNFGDGNHQDVNAALPQRIMHTYAVARTYTVIVAPVAPCAGKFTDRLQVAARGGDRIAGLTIDPSPSDAGRVVTIVVDGTGSCGYRLEFGDGNGEDRSKPLPDRLEHVYNAPGSYQIAAVAGGACEGKAQRTLDVR